MLIISHVCAEFRDPRGGATFTITPAMTRDFITAPEFIRDDPLFQLLIRDGSLQAQVPKERAKALENNPTDGIDASGKAIKSSGEEPAPETKTVKPVKAAKPSKPEKAEQTYPVTEPTDKAIAAK